MRKLLVVLTVAAAISLIFGVSHGPAAPALADKPVKYEFAELRFVRTAGGGNFGGGMPAGFPAGAVGGQGGVRGFGGQPVQVITTSIKFCTGDDEIEADDWKAFADKLKAPIAKKEVSQTVHKLRVLNKLAADGWEFENHPDINAWPMKRRVP